MYLVLMQIPLILSTTVYLEGWLRKNYECKKGLRNCCGLKIKQISLTSLKFHQEKWQKGVKSIDAKTVFVVTKIFWFWTVGELKKVRFWQKSKLDSPELTASIDFSQCMTYNEIWVNVRRRNNNRKFRAEMKSKIWNMLSCKWAIANVKINPLQSWPKINLTKQ